MTIERPRRPRTFLFVAAIALVASASGLGLVLAIRRRQVPGLDTAWMQETLEHRTSPLTGFALIFDWVGGGIVGTIVVPLFGLALLLILRNRWGALFWAISIVLSAGVVQLVKNVVDRSRPPDILVVSDHGSFPSGHTANAATISVVVAVIAWRWWVTALGAVWTLAMALSRTYLGAHWLTDTVGGILVGVGIALLVWGILAARLAVRRESGHAPPVRGRSDSVGT